MHINEVSEEIIGGSICVHSAFGPGLLESAYKAALAHELRKRGLRVEAEVPVPVIHDGVNLGVGFRIDQLVEGCVIVEAKAVMRMTDLHDAQTISHLVLSKHRLALRINFNVRRLKHGIRRFANNL